MQKLLRKARKNQKGFTLVELMVVVVIIGILVAIAIPIYGVVTDNAKERANDANVRTIKGAAQMYASTQPTPLTDITKQTVYGNTHGLDDFLEPGLVDPRVDTDTGYQYEIDGGQVFVYSGTSTSPE